MLNMEWIIEKIRTDGESIMSEVLSDLIKDHQAKKDKMISNYKRYQASEDPDGVPIFSRTFDDKSKINRQDNNAFDADIIDVKLGYMLGNPIIYELGKEKYITPKDEENIFDEQRYALDYSVIGDFNIRNDMDDLDGETEKMASICGYGARLLYIDTEGNERVKNIEPWECIFINDGSLNEAQYSMRYYEITVGTEKLIYVEWYDNQNVTYYVTAEDINDTKGTQMLFIPYERDNNFSISHMFTGNPLYQFLNNEELLGDCDKVYPLIDDYDATISDVASEIEQFRLAYMAFYGMVPDADAIEQAKKTGAFGMPDTESRIEFITKELNGEVVDKHMDRLEQNIYRFAKSVNFKDEAFSGNVSGIAMKFKMFGLESKSIISERKFNTALRNQYKLLTPVWKAKGTDIDYLDMNFIWTRNFPLNLFDEAQTAQLMKGIFPDEIIYGLMSFIDDPDKVIIQMAAQNESMIDMDAPLEVEDDLGDE